MTNARAERIERLVLNTRDLGAACAFYVDALGFSRVGEEASKGGAILELGDRLIELRQVGPDAAEYPLNRSANDPWFQHFAIVVADMERAYSRVEASGGTPISRGGPRKLPASTGGVTAYKFRDPEGHPLELSLLPNSAEWSRVAADCPSALFLGVDHTALAVADLERSVAFYKHLGLSEGPRFLNKGPEQDDLDGLDGVVLDIATLFPKGGGPHIELLHYRSPRGPAPTEVGPHNVASTIASFTADGAVRSVEVRDPDGHRLRLSATPTR